MKTFFRKFVLCAVVITATLTDCKKDVKVEDPPIQGTPGNPRFNLQFTNQPNADLDLYVQTPNGSIIYYGRQMAQGGTLDLDCYCNDCPNGPNENVYWTPGTAPSGTYKFYVKYFEKCTTGSASGSSDYTVRVMQNEKIIDTKKGTLSSTNAQTAIWTYTF